MGILTKPIVGWRRYDVSIPGLLVSNSNVIMPCERSEAYCEGRWDMELKKRHTQCVNGPKLHCTCGFYAFKTVNELFDSYHMARGIIAEVYMWGTVHEYEIGWRAQYTYPKFMYAYGNLAESCSARIARDYQVPVKPFRLQWPDIYQKREEILQRQYEARPDSLTENQLYAAISDGDVKALKVLKARLASAVSNRKKSVVRQEKQLQDTRDSLAMKMEQYDKLKKVKL